jgi:hypothetical protein
MQHVTIPEVPSGGIQAPLLRADQLQPGVILTGQAAVHVWQVVELVGPSSVKMRKVPDPVVGLPHTHAWQPQGRGQACVCGLRVQPVATFLPTSATAKPRAFVVTPPPEGIGQAVTGAIYAYLKPDGQVGTVTLGANGQWSAILPLLPQLHRLWALPEALQAMMDGPEDEDGGPTPPGGGEWFTGPVTFAEGGITTTATFTAPTPAPPDDDDDDDDEDDEDDDTGADEDQDPARDR